MALLEADILLVSLGRLLLCIHTGYMRELNKPRLKKRWFLYCGLSKKLYVQ